MGEEDSKWRKKFQSGVRRFKVEEEESKWRKKIQSGGRRFKVDVVFINSGTIITIIRSYFDSSLSGAGLLAVLINLLAGR